MNIINGFLKFFGWKEVQEAEPNTAGEDRTTDIVFDNARVTASEGHFGTTARNIATIRDAARSRGLNVEPQVGVLEVILYTKGVAYIAKEAEDGFPHHNISEIETVIDNIELGERRGFPINENALERIKHHAYEKLISVYENHRYRNIVQSTRESGLERSIEENIKRLKKEEMFAQKLGKSIPEEKRKKARRDIAQAIETVYQDEIGNDIAGHRSYKALTKAANAEIYICQLEEKISDSFNEKVKEAARRAFDDLEDYTKKTGNRDRITVLGWLSHIKAYAERYEITIDQKRMREIYERIREK